MYTEFHEEAGELTVQDVYGTTTRIAFSWIGRAPGRILYTTPGSLLVESICTAMVVSDEQQAA